MYDTAIVGGGAAGLAAAIFAARRAKSVLLLERLPRVGKKILSTGNGRCNITNRSLALSHYHGQSPDFAKCALSAFPLESTLSFFDSIGLSLVEGENGKFYPKSLQASSVLDLLRLELSRLGVAETVDTLVTKIEKKGDSFRLSSEDGRKFSAKTVLLATGGKAAPSMGTDGQGFALAKSLGHTLVSPFPSLVQVKTEAPMRALKGVKHIGEASIFVDGILKEKARGEILFTDYGLSGPPIFNLSRIAAFAALEKRRAEIHLNLFPDFTADMLLAYLETRQKRLPHLAGESFLYGLLPKQLGKEISRRASSPQTLAKLLTALPFTVSGVMPWANAQVTAGGIATREIVPETMESNLVPGLYFCGEIVDIDGDCGGFNLQWAWSSAYLAAKSL